MSIPREPPNDAHCDPTPPRRPRPLIHGGVVIVLWVLSLAALAVDAIIRPKSMADALPLFGGTVLMLAAASDVFIAWIFIRYATGQRTGNPEDVAIATDIAYRTGHEDGYRAGLQEGLRRGTLTAIDNVFSLRQPEAPQPPPGWSGEDDEDGDQHVTKSSPH